MTTFGNESTRLDRVDEHLQKYLDPSLTTLAEELGVSAEVTEKFCLSALLRRCLNRGDFADVTMTMEIEANTLLDTMREGAPLEPSAIHIYPTE